MSEKVGSDKLPEVCCVCGWSRHEPVFGKQWVHASPKEGVIFTKVVCLSCGTDLTLPERAKLDPDVVFLAH